MVSYNITSANSISKLEGINFDVDQYSRFKFGDKSAARNMAVEMFDAFKSIVDKGTFTLTHRIVVASSPYVYTPAASALIKDEFVKLLNELLAHNDMDMLEEVRIYRSKVYAPDYGNMDMEDRRKLIGTEDFYIDEVFVDECNLVVIDDIRVTGLHETMIVNALELATPSSLDFLYYASVDDNSIPPSIEGQLNFQSIKSLQDLVRLVKSDDYQLTMRALKMILGSNHEELNAFIDLQQREAIKDIYYSSLSNGCHTIPEYAQSIKLLKSKL